MSSHATNVRSLQRAPETTTDGPLQNPYQGFWERWFLPHEETQMVASQASKGLFVPWPLLAIIVTLAIVLVSGLVTLQVQVSNLSTTILLREADRTREVTDLKANMTEIKNKNEQLMVYIQNDREKLVSIQTRLGIKQQ